MSAFRGKADMAIVLALPPPVGTKTPAFLAGRFYSASPPPASVRIAVVGSVWVTVIIGPVWVTVTIAVTVIIGSIVTTIVTVTVVIAGVVNCRDSRDFAG